MDKTSRPDWGGAPLAGEADGARGYVHVAVGEERHASALVQRAAQGRALPAEGAAVAHHHVARGGLADSGAWRGDLARDVRSLQQQGDRRVSDYAPRGTWRTRL